MNDELFREALTTTAWEPTFKDLRKKLRGKAREIEKKIKKECKRDQNRNILFVRKFF